LETSERSVNSGRSLATLGILIGPGTHPLLGEALRALRRLERESVPSPFVFISERGTPFTTAGFARMMSAPHVVVSAYS
jgi:hypothetical protein